MTDLPYFPFFDKMIQLYVFITNWRSMARKRRKIRKHYTISVTSDYSPDSTRYYRSRFNIFRVMTRAMFIVVILGVGLTAFEFYELNQMESKLQVFKTIISEQEDMINELAEEKTDLERLNQVLNNTVARNVKEDEEAARLDEERHIPNGFPLTGSATIEDPEEFFKEEMDATTEYFENILAKQEKKDESEPDPLVLFVMSDLSDVVAVADGRVIEVSDDDEYGKCVKIDHGNGYVTIYKNNSDAKVYAGDEVVRGAIIFVGGEDNNYLGYQVTYDGAYIDPMHVIEIDG